MIPTLTIWKLRLRSETSIIFRLICLVELMIHFVFELNFAHLIRGKFSLISIKSWLAKTTKLPQINLSLDSNIESKSSKYSIN